MHRVDERAHPRVVGLGDIVVMANLSSQKGAGVKSAIKAVSARLLHLPPYSPDFNPMANAFAKLKAALRKAAERTVDSLWNTIGHLIPTFTAAEAQTTSPQPAMIQTDRLPL